MFNFKRKSKIQQLFTPEPTREEVMETIEQIHNRFQNAAEEALQQAKEILAQPIDEEDKKYGEKLLELGFTRTKLAIDVKGIVDNRNYQRARSEIIMHWQAKYPQYKFIFLDQVQSICMKYGLVLGAAERYKGTIPKKNIDEMCRFKIKDEDRIYTTGVVHFDSLWNITASPESQAHPYTHGYSGIAKNKHVGFFICAPEHDMHINSHERVVSGVVTPDPIVLMPVLPQGEAFLIVSKWGIEGDDAELINEREN